MSEETLRDGLSPLSPANNLLNSELLSTFNKLEG